MLFFILWIALCFVAGTIAGKKGRSSVGYFFLAFFLSPLIGIIVALAVSADAKNVERQQIETGDNKKCPFCAEIIKSEAKVCRYCGRDLPVENSVKASSLDERFNAWLKAQSPPVVNPTPAQRAEYRQAFEYKLSKGEL
jgi:hypothetical protein